MCDACEPKRHWHVSGGHPNPPQTARREALRYKRTPVCSGMRPLVPNVALHTLHEHATHRQANKKLRRTHCDVRRVMPAVPSRNQSLPIAYPSGGRELAGCQPRPLRHCSFGEGRLYGTVSYPPERRYRPQRCCRICGAMACHARMALVGTSGPLARRDSFTGMYVPGISASAPPPPALGTCSRKIGVCLFHELLA